MGVVEALSKAAEVTPGEMQGSGHPQGRVLSEICTLVVRTIIPVILEAAAENPRLEASMGNLVRLSQIK